MNDSCEIPINVCINYVKYNYLLNIKCLSLITAVIIKENNKFKFFTINFNTSKLKIVNKWIVSKLNISENK